jgi:hypothetical protein
MDDTDVLQRIEKLVADEHELRERHSRGELQSDARQQLERIEANLDQCWDLLRQRRALRESGADPNAAGVRPVEVVERYQQ